MNECTDVVVALATIWAVWMGIQLFLAICQDLLRYAIRKRKESNRDVKQKTPLVNKKFTKFQLNEAMK